MLPPPGIGLNRQILQLDKAIYGLKQAPLAWFANLSEDLVEMGFISVAFDTYVFISGDHKILVVVYLDNITPAGSCSHINRRIDHLRSGFKVTLNCRLNYILGIKIKHIPDGVELPQQQYISNILSHW